MLRQQMLPKLAEYDYIYTFGTTATHSCFCYINM